MKKNIQKLINLIMKVRRKILRKIYQFFNLRPTSYPFISGDGFRKMANHIYEKKGRIKLHKIKEGQIIFVQTDLIYDFFENIHPQIIHPYKLITHNGDGKITAKELKFIDEKIIIWYAQNVETYHGKLIPIPIGIENKFWHANGYELLQKYNKLDTNKEKFPKILLNFSIKTNKKHREYVYKTLYNQNNVVSIYRIKPSEYFEILNNYMFIASPEGNGPDCHRTWEAIVLGVIPITDSNFLCNHFKKMGAPILPLMSWNEINALSESDLKAKYAEIYNSKIEIIKESFWRKIILE